MAPVGAAVGPAPKIEALSQIGAGGVVGHAAAAWDESLIETPNTTTTSAKAAEAYHLKDRGRPNSEVVFLEGAFLVVFLGIPLFLVN